MTDTKKDIIGGMDTGGGVGFGIPADWGGGVQEADPDPVLDQHNDKAKTAFNPVLLSPKVDDSYRILATRYVALPTTSSVRKRAEEFEKRYASVGTRYAQAEQNLLKQQATALALRSIARQMATHAHAKMGEWSSKVEDGKLPDDAIADYKGTLRTWQDSVVATLEEHEIKMLHQVSKSLTKGFDILSSIDIASENPFSGEFKFDKVAHAFDSAVGELDSVATSGGGEILAEHKSSKQAYDSETEELERMKKELSQAVAKTTQGAAKYDSRVLNEIEGHDEIKADYGDEVGIPNRVPNYRLALETSPRVCGSCRFFEWDGESERGDCHAFQFMAKANYTCDAWQGMSLTSTHTTVRNEGDKMYSRKKNVGDGYLEPVHTSPVIEKDGTPKESVGRVSGERIRYSERGEHGEGVEGYIIEDGNYSIPREPDENYALRAQAQDFLPNDVVYSKFARSLAVVTGSATMGGLKVYSLKLIDSNGVAGGTAFSYGDDLQPRGKSAMKTRRNRRARKSADIQDMVESIRSVYRALQDVVEHHSDVVKAPLSNQDVLTPLQQDMQKMLQDPMFNNVTTGPKRKYYRALQDATYSIGAARQVLFEGFKTINKVKRRMGGASTKGEIDNAKRTMRDVMMDSQGKAYDRVKNALKKIEDSLTIASATHGHPAPGFKGMSIKDISDKVFDLVSANVAHDNIEVVTEGMPLGEYEFTVHKYNKQGGLEKAHATVASLMERIKKIGERDSLEVDIIGSQTSELEDKSGFAASVTFDVFVIV